MARTASVRKIEEIRRTLHCFRNLRRFRLNALFSAHYKLLHHHELALVPFWLVACDTRPLR